MAASGTPPPNVAAPCWWRTQAVPSAEIQVIGRSVFVSWPNATSPPGPATTRPTVAPSNTAASRGTLVQFRSGCSGISVGAGVACGEGAGDPNGDPDGGALSLGPGKTLGEAPAGGV